MALDQYYEDTITQTDFIEDHKSFLEKWLSDTSPVTNSDDEDNQPFNGFDCNICLDSVEDPVVTLCGHLYCWPCIYKWLHLKTTSSETLQCPVCKASVSQSSLVPLYGRGQTSNTSKALNLGMSIPRRPSGHSCVVHAPTPRPTQHYPTPSLTPLVQHPLVGMFGEMVYAQVFGGSIPNVEIYPNSYGLAGSNSRRLQMYLRRTDKSLSRIWFFLLCSAVLSLLLF